MKDRWLLLVIFSLLFIPTSLSFLFIQSSMAQIDDDEPIIPSSPTDVYILEGAAYDAPIGDERPIVHFFGVIYWERLADSFLNFFINTSDVIDDTFRDYETKKTLDEYDPSNDQCASNYNSFAHRNSCVTRLNDRYIIIPESRSFEYEITAYYDPDIVYDTGFIVIFNSQSVDFSILVEDEQVYAKVDYRNVITLPPGAGVVSFAPIDKGFLGIDKTEDGRWQLIWEYKHRAMDSRHDPLIIEVTYAFDEIFLKFTEQIYQNQQEQQRRIEEENRLDILNASFVVIATLAIVASIFSVLFAYLLARKRFQPKLDRARELPRRTASDIEKSESLKVPTKSLLLSGLIIFPLIFSPIPVTSQIENQNIIWNGIYDLNEDLTMTEEVEIIFPVYENEAYVYINTSNVDTFEAFDEFGTELPNQDEGHRYKVSNPGFSFTYKIKRSYKNQLHNNSQMLVFLDRFWMEFLKPADAQQFDDRYFHVDLRYTVLLPNGAFLYSASPSDLLEISKTKTGRWNITFTDTDRQMDAFHDVFETQITFSFVSILEAIEDLDIPFELPQQDQQDIDELIKVASSEILLFSILGIIAPLISFLIAYWVLKRRYQKLIERIEQQQEEQIFIEGPQIQALAKAVAKESGNRVYEGYAGHYWRLINKLSTILKRDVSIMDNWQISEEIIKQKIKVDISRISQLLTMGQSILPDDSIGYDQLYEYSQEVDDILQEL
ncbi:MAG: hypothetical protein ACXAD7_04090 [Candidatus Kariarchaeaceae archaeon]|jgi:hypothetical protein